jgi:hypothetical protein
MIIVIFLPFAAIDDEPVSSHLKTDVDLQPAGRILKEWILNVKKFVRQCSSSCKKNFT